MHHDPGMHGKCESFAQPLFAATYLNDWCSVQVQDFTGVSVKNQLLSTTPLNVPKYVESNGTSTLASLNIKHGDMLHLKGEATRPAAASSRPASASAHVARTFKLSDK